MAEQRSSRRYAMRRPVACRPVSGVHDVSWPGVIRDVSCGGIGVTARRRFERGALLMVQSAADPDGGFLKLVQVRHIRPQADRQCFLGCAFVAELSADELTAFRCRDVAAAGPPA